MKAIFMKKSCKAETAELNVFNTTPSQTSVEGGKKNNTNRVVLRLFYVQLFFLY
jgi:hypothetical protein